MYGGLGGTHGVLLQCFGAGPTGRVLRDENEWLKRMLEREQHARQIAQFTLHQEQIKSAVLETEMLHAARAAQEMSENLCMYLANEQAGSDVPGPSCTPWSVYSTKPMLNNHTSNRDQNDASDLPPLKYSTPPSIPQKGDTHSLKDSVHMRQHMLRLSQQLKGLATKWRKQMDSCDTPISDIGRPQSAYNPSAESSFEILKLSPVKRAAPAHDTECMDECSNDADGMDDISLGGSMDSSGSSE
eukprot:jgi/Chrzof1/7827/Cz02g38010.t1